MPYFEVFLLLALGALGGFWYTGFRAREVAMQAARQTCQNEGVQLLDDTVALAGLGVGRDEHGVLQLKREYAFEYSDTGDNRRKGKVVMFGPRVETVYVGPRLAAIDGEYRRLD